MVLGCGLLVLDTRRLLAAAGDERFKRPSIHPVATPGIATSRHLGFQLAGILTVDAAVKRHITLSGRQGSLGLPPEAARTEDPPRTRTRR
jgi:hypothetical protein